MKISYQKRNGREYLTPEFVAEIYHKNLIIEAPRGGLILGPSHAEGGVKMFAYSNTRCAGSSEG